MDDDDQMERIDRLEAKVDELSELVRHLSAMIIQQNNSNVHSSTPKKEVTLLVIGDEIIHYQIHQQRRK